MVENRQHGSGYQAHFGGHGRGGRQEDNWVGAVSAVRVKVVLDGPNAGKAEAFASRVNSIAPFQYSFAGRSAGPTAGKN